MKRGGVMRRDWSAARAKCDIEGRCRIEGCPNQPLEAAHTIGRRWDSEIAEGVIQVHPDSVVPLCRKHHDDYDQHGLDLLAHLRIEEQVDAVSRVGLERAYRRLCPSLYREATL